MRIELDVIADNERKSLESSITLWGNDQEITLRIDGRNITVNADELVAAVGLLAEMP